MNRQLIDKYQSLVDHFGSQQQAADALAIAQPSVNAWLKGKAKMSFHVALRAERATQGQFKASDLCPALKEATHA